MIVEKGSHAGGPGSDVASIPGAGDRRRADVAAHVVQGRVGIVFCLLQSLLLSLLARSLPGAAAQPVRVDVATRITAHVLVLQLVHPAGVRLERVVASVQHRVVPRLVEVLHLAHEVFVAQLGPRNAAALIRHGDDLPRRCTGHAAVQNEPPSLHLKVYRGVMTRTNIEIDDVLVEEAMRRYSLPSKRAAVELALRRLVGEALTRDEALDMEGSGWDSDLAQLRTDRAHRAL